MYPQKIYNILIKNIFIIFLLIGTQSCTKKNKYFLTTKEVNSTNISEQKKNYKIILLTPMSGVHAKSGLNIADAVFKSLYDSGVNNVVISIFDTGSDPNNIRNYQKIKNAINKIQPDIVIGPLLKRHVELIEEAAIENKDIKFFSLSNSDFENLSPRIRQNNSYDMKYFNVMTNYIAHLNRGNFALISSKERFNNIMNFKKTLTHKGFNVMFSDLFDSSNENSFKKVALSLKNNYRKINVVDREGNVVKNNIKNKIKITDQDGEYDYRYELIDTIYIDGNSSEIMKMISALENQKILQRDIVIFTNDSIIESHNLNINNIDNVFFITKVNSKLSNFYKDFYKDFKYKPLKIAINAYDITSLLLYLIKNNMLSDENIDFNYGFYGVLGKFRYKDSKIERVFNVYRIRGKTVELMHEGRFS